MSTEMNKDTAELNNLINSFSFLRLIIFADIITRFSEIEVKHNINWLETFILIILATNGSHSLSMLAKRILRSNHSMTRLIDNLVKNGLVRRYHPANDRRSLNVSITAKGLDHLSHTLKDLKLAEEEIRSCLGPNELDTLTSLTKTLRSQLLEKLNKRYINISDKKAVD
jgi:DNA-binding MarR family transcriptional regulator